MMLKKFCLAAVIALALLAEFFPVAIHAQTDQSAASAVSLVGSYKLLAITRKTLDTGEVTDPFGKQPSGYIVYTPNGRMLVLVVADKNDRPAPESGAAPTDKQSASLFRTMVSYGGTYDFDGHAVKHHIDFSWNQAWTGTTQTRDVQKDGDRLIYTTRPAPSLVDGKMSVVTIVWQKSD
jgi:Lipocalin-like domain